MYRAIHRPFPFSRTARTFSVAAVTPGVEGERIAAGAREPPVRGQPDPARPGRRQSPIEQWLVDAGRDLPCNVPASQYEQAAAVDSRSDPPRLVAPQRLDHPCRERSPFLRQTSNSPSRPRTSPDPVSTHNLPSPPLRAHMSVRVWRGDSGLSITAMSTPSNRASPLSVPIQMYPSGVCSTSVTAFTGSPASSVQNRT